APLEKSARVDDEIHAAPPPIGSASLSRNRRDREAAGIAQNGEEAVAMAGAQSGEMLRLALLQEIGLELVAEKKGVRDVVLGLEILGDFLALGRVEHAVEVAVGDGAVLCQEEILRMQQLVAEDRRLAVAGAEQHEIASLRRQWLEQLLEQGGLMRG